MKIKPDRATVSKLVAILLFSGLFVWMVRQIKYQLVLSKMDIVEKSFCAYSPEKSAVIFLDDRAIRSMRRFRVTATKIIAETNEIFAEHGLPNRYNLKNLRLRSWSTGKKNCIFRDDFPDKTGCFLNEMLPRYLAEKNDSDPDVVIFMTATGISDVSGIARWGKNRDGNGSIVVNIGLDLKSYDSDKKLSRVAKKFFLRRFAHLFAHEQTHLYGVDHSSAAHSVMNQYSNAFGDRRVKFDEESLKTLTDREKELATIKKQCAAQK